MYIDSINKNNKHCSLSAFGNVLICSNSISADKTVTFPNGYELDSNLSFKILFKNGHNCANSFTHMTLNSHPIVVNKDGLLIPLPIHTMTESNATVYKSLQPNTILEMYFDSTYSNYTGAFVVIGNPIVLSSDDYTIYANGKIGNEEVGVIKAKATNEIPYGWLECNGQSVSRTTYSVLFNKFNTQKYDGLHTLLSKYGYIDNNHFNLPDYREVALVGVGINTIDTNLATHDSYTLGEFKDDQLQKHSHTYPVSYPGTLGSNGNIPYSNSSSADRHDVTSWLSGGRIGTPDVTRGKRKGVIYLIKVL